MAKIVPEENQEPSHLARILQEMTLPECRPETEILADLEELCTSPGYAHALAFLCCRENFATYVDDLKPEDLGKMRPWDRLIRPELSLLHGLMVKAPLDLQQPSSGVIQEYIDGTEKFLSELHEAMKTPFWVAAKETGFDSKKGNPLTVGEALREPFFYSGETAYFFQYRDFSAERYKEDEQWFRGNKGFSPGDVGKVIDAITNIQIERCEKLAKELREKSSVENIQVLTLLPVFMFTAEEIVEKTRHSLETVKNILKAFSLPCIPCNSSLKEIGSFNEVNAFPLISYEDRYLLFQDYYLAEAFYESPFFWMMQDRGYAEKAKENRGLFTEKFSANRLRSVLGADRVYENVYLLDGKGQRAGEIDVLAVFADRAVILQAKSKRLTEASRKGNDKAIRTDFQKGIQHAYDQGFKCAKLIIDSNYKIADGKNNPIAVRRNFAEIFVFCVVSENYPALAHQADQFLNKTDHNIIMPPYVMNVFFLDIMCEMLDSPLHFFNFVHRRLNYLDRIKASSEMTILSYHLACNLWVRDDVEYYYINDDVSMYLDAAMSVRRNGLPGKRTPDGLLTKLEGTTFDHIIKQISEIEHDHLIEIGYFLLEGSYEACEGFSKACDMIIDGQMHDFSFGMGEAGITIHASSMHSDEGRDKLERHCCLRKYDQKRDKWFGLALSPHNKTIQLAMVLSFPWKYEKKMDEAVKSVGPKPLKSFKQAIHQHHNRKNKKPGRNERCPCGSGKKFKKCCGRSF